MQYRTPGTTSRESGASGDERGTKRTSSMLCSFLCGRCDRPYTSLLAGSYVSQPLLVTAAYLASSSMIHTSCSPARQRTLSAAGVYTVLLAQKLGPDPAGAAPPPSTPLPPAAATSRRADA